MSSPSSIPCSHGHSYECSESEPGEYERVCIRVLAKKRSPERAKTPLETHNLLFVSS